MKHIFPYSASLEGIINNEKISLRGTGIIDEQIGLAEGKYTLNSVPSNFPVFLLTSVILTGYPNASANTDGLKNVFKNNSYAYERFLDFGLQGSLKLTATCKRHDNGFESDFYLEGNVSIPEIISAESLVESWQPMQGNHIQGNFISTWKTKDDQIVTAHAKSSYTIDTDIVVRDTMHRFIELVPKIEGNMFLLKQNTKLFKDMATI